MTSTNAQHDVTHRPSRVGTFFMWVWRAANTAVLAAAAWALWRQSMELAALNDALQTLIDYLDVIAERLG